MSYSENFQQQILKGIPDELPEIIPFDDSVKSCTT
jgi:hypothetical protein